MRCLLLKLGCSALILLADAFGEHFGIGRDLHRQSRPHVDAPSPPSHAAISPGPIARQASH